MFYDITERKRLEREILEIAESERRRIGQDLHDGLGQQLTGIAFLSRILERNLEGVSAEHAAQMHRIADLVAQAINYTRNLSRMLSPVDIPADGFTDALRRLAESTSEFSHVECRLDCSGDLPLSSNSAATHLYRITQEALTNALKHASPTEIVIELLAQEKQGVLRITDNGKGISKSTAENSSGLGMRTMEYRSNVIGAALSVRARRGGGTIVECRFPIG
jgi:signal transduction histidine kinase